MKSPKKPTGKNNHVKTPLSLIIHGSTNHISVDSRVLANEFGRRHDNVLQTIRGLIDRGTISPLEAKEREYTNRGKKQPCYELNEAGFLKAMPFIGGRKSEQGQCLLVDAFLKQRHRLDRQAKERESLAYQVARLSGKDSRGILTDAIKSYVSYAKATGSQNADRYFSNITNAVYNAMLVLEPDATEVRELLTAIQLSTLNTFELVAAQTITEGLDTQQPYKIIYQTVKTALNSFANERPRPLGY